MKRLIFIFALVLSLDQATKFLAERELKAGPVSVVPGLFDLTLVYNPGAAFGLFSGLPDTQRRFALAAVSLLALGVVVWFGLNEAKGDRWFQAGLSAIVAGAVGNLLDRLRLDAVVDFLDFYVGEHHWPAFNVADSAICIGVCLLLLRMLFFSPARAANEGTIGNTN